MMTVALKGVLARGKAGDFIAQAYGNTFDEGSIENLKAHAGKGAAGDSQRHYAEVVALLKKWGQETGT
jgi:hypothetical protein